MNNTIIIIGSGLAGYTLAREFRKLDKTTPLMLITRDAGDFYSKPMLSNDLAQNKTAEQLVTTPADAIAVQLDLTLHTQTEVTRIDKSVRLVETTAGNFDYAKLIFALGADPIRLPLAGAAADEVLSVNDIADYARFRQRVANKKHIAIVGAGLIGCEFANDLANAGYKVTVIDPTAYPLSSLLPELAGKQLLGPLQQIGVTFRFGVAVSAVDKNDAAYKLTLNNGEIINADLVLSAVGLRPRIALARGTGLSVNRGIVVNHYAQSSDEHIYALGDCAEYHGGVTLPYVMPIMHAARALAQTLAGTQTAVAFPSMPVIIKTPAHPVVVQPAPKNIPGVWQLLESDGGVKMAFTDNDNKIHGFVLTGTKTAERQAMLKLLAL
ncbi:MAG: FAD-dependent oxidoreductase [Burkholderiales bacterium]